MPLLMRQNNVNLSLNCLNAFRNVFSLVIGLRLVIVLAIQQDHLQMLTSADWCLSFLFISLSLPLFLCSKGIVSSAKFWPLTLRNIRMQTPIQTSRAAHTILWHGLLPPHSLLNYFPCYNYVSNVFFYMRVVLSKSYESCPHESSEIEQQNNALSWLAAESVPSVIFYQVIPLLGLE